MNEDDRRSSDEKSNAVGFNVTVGIVLGAVVANIVATWIVSIPVENEQRFWQGGAIFWLTVILSAAVGVLALIASLIRRSARGLGLLAFASNVGVTLYGLSLLFHGFAG